MLDLESAKIDPPANHFGSIVDLNLLDNFRSYTICMALFVTTIIITHYIIDYTNVYNSLSIYVLRWSTILCD